MDKCDQLINAVNDLETMETEYKKMIQDELQLYGCNDLEKAYQFIFGEINAAGLWYRAQKRIEKQKK